MRLLWTVLLACQLLAAGESFEGYEGRPLDLLSLFLPADPKIYATKGFEEELISYWPKAQLSNQADLIRINLDSPEPLADLPLSSAQAVYVDAFLYPEEGTPEFLALKRRLEESGFFLFTRWNSKGALASALFVRRDFFYSSSVATYLKHSSIVSGLYTMYTSIAFAPYYGQMRYWLDDDTDDSVKETLKTGWAYEGNLSFLIHDLTKPHSVAIDIGAHLGVHTIFMSRKTGPHGVVISFEPHKKLYMEQLANMELNGCKNVLSICKGLGSGFQRAYLRKIEIEQSDPLFGEGDFIDIVPLDAYNFNNVSLIKMDVENYEYFVLQGAKETLLRNKPVIIFECWIDYDNHKRNGERQRENFERVMALVESYGYDVHVLYNCDFLAIPKETRDELLLSCKQKYPRLDPKTYRGEGATATQT